MKNILLTQLIKVFLSMLDEKLMRKFGDMVLDFIENYTLGSASTIDDQILLPLCAMIRKTFDIPDEDEDK